jgi:DNA polymerase-4
VVGGDPRGRGVVATASYAARRFGIRSAMSCAEALRRCPEAVFVRPDMAAYREWSERVWALLGELCARVEQVGLDEGYLLLDAADPVAHARAVQAAVAERARLSASLGVATSKVVAKIASDRDKPRGLTVVPAGTEARFLAPLALRALPGVGPRTEERLRAAGVETIGALAALADDALSALLPGQVGPELRRRALGVDPREVLSEPRERRSVSSERTFAEDVGDPARLAELLEELAGAVAAHLRRRGEAARTVSVKVRYPDFRTVTRAHTAGAATDDAEAIGAVAGGLLAAALRERPGPLRLLGVGASGLASHTQLTLAGSPGWAGDGLGTLAPWP